MAYLDKNLFRHPSHFSLEQWCLEFIGLIPLQVSFCFCIWFIPRRLAFCYSHSLILNDQIKASVSYSLVIICLDYSNPQRVLCYSTALDHCINSIYY